MIDKLNKIIADLIQPLVERHDWKPTDPETSSRGASQGYVAGNIVIRVLNDHGLLDVELGPAHDRAQLRSVSMFKDLLEPPSQGRWNLSIQQQCDFIEKYWEWLQHSLDREHASQTIGRFDNLPL